jgi:D-sedoheptulose 7-phosphate isomerase
MMQPQQKIDGPFDLSFFAQGEMAEHRQAFEATRDAIDQPFSVALTIIVGRLRGGGRLLICGNGGSAATAQHIAGDLTIASQDHRLAIPALALATDSSTLAACGNDLGYDLVFARQIETIAKSSDVVLCISTSSNAPNILKGLKAARHRGAATIGLTGGSGGHMPDYCDVTIAVPSRVAARIHEMHLMIGHMLCKALEQRLGLV